MILVLYLCSVLFYFVFIFVHDAISVRMYNKYSKKRVYFKKLKVLDFWKTYTRIQRFLLIAMGFIPLLNLFVIGMILTGLIDDCRSRKKPH